MIIRGDARALPLVDACVDCIVTSPPYFGLRDYGTAGQIGLEPTPDAYVGSLVQVFRELRRVLKDSGTVWVNLGDSYANDTKWGGQTSGKHALSLHGKTPLVRARRSLGLKSKDLIGIPWRVAFALQAPDYIGTIARLEDRIWLAAMLDAEGCMFIHKRKAGQSNGQGYYRQSDTYGPGVEIANTSVAVVERIAALVGKGSICSQGPEQTNGRRRQTIYRWNLRTTESRDFVRELYPHLIAKQHQARLLCGCPSSGVEAERAHAGLMALHRGAGTSIDFAAPASLFTPGWYLRSDIIWSKLNPMPESVTDRPTKAHEYLFLLSKSERYFYDAQAIAEPSVDPESLNGRNKRNDDEFCQADPSGFARTRVGFANIQPGKMYLTKNRRSVWTIPTRQFPFSAGTSRQVRVAWDASDGDTTRIASPDCPVHGDRAVLAAKALCGERAAGSLSRSGRSDDGRALAPLLDCVPIAPPPVDCSVAESSDSSARSHEPPAMPRSSQSRRTGHAPATSPSCRPSDETPADTGDTSTSPPLSGADSRTLESSTPDRDGQAVAALAESLGCTVGTCSCAYYRTVTEQTSHFATMPEALVEPCILAGCPIGGLVLDPFVGSGTVVAVAERLGRNGIGVDLAYHALSKERTAQRGLKFV